MRWFCRADRRIASIAGNLDCAGYAVGREHQVDRTAKLMRNEIANEAGSVSALEPALIPDGPPVSRHTIIRPLSHRHCAGIPSSPTPGLRGDRQRAVFGGVRHKLVQHHRQRLGCRSVERDVGPAGRRVCVRCVGSKLVTDKIGKANALPLTLAQ